jgi:hypothetical protein
LQQPETKPTFTPRVLISHVIRATSIVCRVRRDMLTSDTRNAPLVEARNLAMAVAMALTRHSLPAIGREFGGRDHSTVLRAIRAADEAAARDPLVARTMREIAARAREIAGISPRTSAVSALRDMPPRAEPAKAADLTDDQRREARHLRAKGWSIGGLMRRYGIGEDEAYAAVGEKSPRQIAA